MRVVSQHPAQYTAPPLYWQRVTSRHASQRAQNVRSSPPVKAPGARRRGKWSCAMAAFLSHATCHLDLEKHERFRRRIDRTTLPAGNLHRARSLPRLAFAPAVWVTLFPRMESFGVGSRDSLHDWLPCDVGARSLVHRANSHVEVARAVEVHRANSS
jgi:hypothetical protein